MRRAKFIAGELRNYSTAVHMIKLCEVTLEKKWALPCRLRFAVSVLWPPWIGAVQSFCFFQTRTARWNRKRSTPNSKEPTKLNVGSQQRRQR